MNHPEVAPNEAQEQLAGNPFARWDALFALLVFAGSFWVYWKTLAPDILWGDSGEFQMLTATGGLAHATGYPIYLLIAKLVALLPAGDIPYRVNLLSAIMGALAVSLCYLICVSLGVRRLFAGLACILLALNHIFWWQSVIAEVYTTGIAFLLAFLLCAILWARTRRLSWLVIGGVIGGLCFGVHFTALLAAPLIALFMGSKRAKGREWAMAGLGALCGVTVALIAYYIMATPDLKTAQINVVRPSVSTYGMKPEDLSTPLARMKFLITAREFRRGFLQVEDNYLASAVSDLKSNTLAGFGWIGTLLGVLGVLSVFTLKKRRKEGLLLFGAGAVILGFALTYSIRDVKVDFIPVYAFFAIFVGIGLQSLQELIFAKRPARTPVRLAVGVAAVVIVLLGAAGAVSDLADSVDAGHITYLRGLDEAYPYPVLEPSRPRDLGRDVVERIPDGTLLVTKWQNVYPCMYVAYLEQGKKNVEVIEHLSYNRTGTMAESLIEYLAKSCRERPVYITGVPATIRDRFEFVPIPGRFPLYRMYPLQ